MVLAALGTAVYAQNYYPPPDAELSPKTPNGLVMDYEPDQQLLGRAAGKPAIERDPAYLTNEANPEAVAEVVSGKRTVANAAWWGFDPHDSTATLQAAIDSGVKKLVIPNMGQDWIVEPLFLNSDNQELVFESGVIVMAKKGSFLGKNDSLFTAEGRNHITLRGYGATLQMRKQDYKLPPYPKAEWRAGLTLVNCSNVTILGLAIRETGGDGIYVGGQLCKDFVIRDVVCDGNNRQGMSVISAENLLVENCVFSNTAGTSPMAGIDLEPNQADQKMVNVRIRNCIFENNNRRGLLVNLRLLKPDSDPISVVFENNYVRGGERGIEVALTRHHGGKGLIEFKNNIIENTSHAGVMIGCKSSLSMRIVFENLLLNNVAIGTKPAICSPAPILFHARSDASQIPGAVEFNNCFVYESENSNRVLRGGPAILMTGGHNEMVWTDVHGMVTASTPGKVDKNINMSVKNFTLTLNGQRVSVDQAAKKAGAREENAANPQAIAEVLAGKRSLANAAWWGFDEHDSTAALQAAIDSGVRKLIVPNMGKEWIVEPLFLTQNHQEILFEPGVVVMAKQGAFRGRNDSLLTATDRINITLRGYGATLQMRKRDYQSPPYEKAEWRAGLTCVDCQDVTVLGLTIRDTGGDGLYFGGNVCKDVLVKDVVCDNNHRQGMSIISTENFVAENCIFSNTIGTAPMAGIDLEPNMPGQRMSNVIIRNCIFDNNAMMGMHMNLLRLDSDSQPVSVLWDSNYVRGGEIGIHVTGTGEDTPRGLIEFSNNIVENTRHAAIMIRKKQTAAGRFKVVFNNHLLRNTTTLEPYDQETVNFFRQHYGIQYPSQWWRHATHWWRNFPVAPIVLRGGSANPMGGVALNGCFSIERKDVPAMVVAGSGNPRGENHKPGWSDISGNITTSNPFGAWVDIRTPVKDFTLTINGRPVRP